MKLSVFEILMVLCKSPYSTEDHDEFTAVCDFVANLIDFAYFKKNNFMEEEDV